MLTNSTIVTEKSNPKSQKRPQWQFRGQTIPARMFHLMLAKKVSCKDFLLLCLVDSLVKAQGTTGEDGVGCWAANAYLAEALDTHETYIPQQIAKLEKAGLLLVVRIGGRRWLEAEWSRTAEERADIPGEYGKELRRQHSKLTARLEDAEESKKNEQQKWAEINTRIDRIVGRKPLGKTKPDPVEPLVSPKTPPLEKPKPNNKDKQERGEGGQRREAAAPTPQVNGHSRLNGKASVNGVHVHVNGFSVKPAQECYEAQDKVRSILRTNKVAVTNWGRDKGAESVQALVKKVGWERVNYALKSYERNFKKVSRPTIVSVHQFCRLELFAWLEDVLKNLDGKVQEFTEEGEPVFKQKPYRIKYNKSPDGTITPEVVYLDW